MFRYGRIKVFLILFVSVVFGYGQNLLPPIYNYSLLEYNGGSKNWDVATSADGELFIANNKGLLFFNGEEWQLYKLPNKTTIRSVAVVEDKVYTGSYEEFGYWKKNQLGNLDYTSLTHLIKGHEFTSEEFWKILPVGNAILFRSFSSIYIYEEGKIAVLNPTEVISDITTYNGDIIVAGGSQGLFRLENNKMVPLSDQELFRGKTITDMVLWNEGLVVGTKLNGCYFFDGVGLKPLKLVITDDLKQHQLNKMLVLSPEKVAFGTIKNGVYLLDLAQNTFKILNKASGLQNNTVLSMARFQDQLWLGLDNGIARARLNSPITYYTDYSGALGMVYDIVEHENRLYLGSNTGVFYFEDNDLKFVNGSLGHVWDLEKVGGDLFCGHNTGTYSINNNSFTKISDVSGGYEIKKVPEQTNTYIQGTYNGLASFRKDSNGEWAVNRLQGIDFPVKQLCFESPNVLWAAHPYKGLYRVHLNNEYSAVSKIESYNDRGAPSEYNIKIYKIKNQIVFYSEGKWFKYDAIQDEVIIFNEFQRFNSKELLLVDNDHFWFVEGDGDKKVISTDLKSDSLLITDLPLRQRLAPDSQKMIRTGDNTLLATLNDGFAKLQPNNLKQLLDSVVLPKPVITLIKDERQLYPPSSTNVVMRYPSSRMIIVQVAAPKLMQARYRYKLQGAEMYSAYAENGIIQFQNLPHGTYQLEVVTVGMDNEVSEPVIVAFTIARPWFLSNVMIAVYLALSLTVIFVVRWYNRRKLQRKQQELELKLKKEQEEKLAVLEREKLAREVKIKQNELASTTLNIAKKNEMILELKNLLVLNKEKFSNSQRYRSFIKKLDNSIQDTEDWKRFEVNFKELHDDFFERLLKEYPNLTPKDLKLCAYLKMNLSTKEIAPLMAISIRGVEIHRYRLRKKLEIDTSKNLSNFLITF